MKRIILPLIGLAVAGIAFTILCPTDPVAKARAAWKTQIRHDLAKSELPSVVRIGVGTKVVQDALDATFKNRQFPDQTAKDYIKIKQVAFLDSSEDGLPMFRGEAEIKWDGKWAGFTTSASVEAALIPQFKQDGSVDLKVQLLSLSGVPSAVVAQANNVLPCIPLPIQRELKITLASKPQDIPVKVPSGTLTITLTPPSVAPLTRKLVPIAVFAKTGGLCIAAAVMNDTENVSSPPPLSQDTMSSTMAKWSFSSDHPSRCFAQVDPRVISAAVEELASRPDAERTLKVQGKTLAGNLFERSGGLPFGNGFKVYLDGPTSLTGSTVLQSPKLQWEDDKAVLTLSDTEIKDGKAQGHFHGNAPHIQPKLFGIKITGGIGVGGGAGSSIGVVFSAKALAPTLAMKGTTQGREVSFSLTRDLKITYDFHLKGLGRDIESAVINAFGLDKSFTVPSSKPLYVWTIPDLTMASAGFSTKSEKTQVVIGKSGIEIASDVIVSSTPAP